MAVKKPDVGKEIEAYCGKCKEDSVHVITAMKGDIVDKVMCKGCNSTHKYKLPKSAGDTGEKKRGRPKKKTGRTAGRRRKNDWATLVSQIEDNKIVDYAIDSTYHEMDAIQHKKFGVGVITKILDINKIEVVFESNTKILAQNWQ
jgi:hypothetical protein